MKKGQLTLSPFAKRLADSGALPAEKLGTLAGLAASAVLERASSWMDSEILARAAAAQAELAFVDLEEAKANKAALKFLPLEFALRLGCAPLLRGKSKAVAVSNPFDLLLRRELEQRLGQGVALVVATAGGIALYLDRLQDAGAELRGLEAGLRARNAGASTGSKEEADGPVVHLVLVVLRSAIERRASDIHFESHRDGTSVKFRIDGVLYPATGLLDAQHRNPMISRLKVMAGLDIAENRIPQDGRFSQRLGDSDIDFRVSVLPTNFGEDVVIRILDHRGWAGRGEAPSLQALGLGPRVLGQLRRAAREPYGMLLVTGPTGSGKTTTLYAAIHELDRGSEKIITIEDPVEYQLPGVVQVPVNDRKQLTFARGLRSILRHDPDKIMVGEIRDAETAQIAVQSALTGHLVFSTVHANNAVDVLGRLSHMGINTYGFVSALKSVMAQRLVRLACEHCKKKAAPPKGSRGRGRWISVKGCRSCHGTGYHGRTAVAEFMRLTPKVRALILEQASVDQIQEQAVREGMVTLREAALELASRGLTTMEEVNRVTFVD
jgi:type IV pilus assembly protein PilB